MAALAAQPETAQGAQTSLGEGEVALEVISLSKVYPNGRGIHEISFEVRKGEIFGLLGPNGAGKTTTIRTALDFIRPTGGSALLLGRDAQSSPAARVSVGFLPGDLALSVRTTARDWLSFQSELRSGVDQTYLMEIAEQLEADLDEPMRNLSSGNRQKIGVINALMHRPEFVVMDEPAAGLDPLIRRRLYRLLIDVRERGGAVLLSSHVLPEVERICDRVGIIRGGRLVEVSTIAELRSASVRRLDIVFAHEPPLEPLRQVSGVVEATSENSIAHVAVSGPLTELIRALGEFDVVDLSTGGQALEDQFMSYYDDDAAAGEDDLA